MKPNLSIDNMALVDLRHGYYCALAAHHKLNIVLKRGQYIQPRKGFKVGNHRELSPAQIEEWKGISEAIQAAGVPSAVFFAAAIQRAALKGYPEPNTAQLCSKAFIKYVIAFDKLGFEAANSKIISNQKYAETHPELEAEAIATKDRYYARARVERAKTVGGSLSSKPPTDFKVQLGCWIHVVLKAREAGMSPSDYVDFSFSYQAKIKKGYPGISWLRSDKGVALAKESLQTSTEVPRSHAKATAHIVAHAEEMEAENRRQADSKVDSYLRQIAGVARANKISEPEAYEMLMAENMLPAGLRLVGK